MPFDILNFILQPQILIIVVVWSLFWKGLALWSAAKRNDKSWFVVLLILNTVGLVEIVYLATRKERSPIKRFYVDLRALIKKLSRKIRRTTRRKIKFV